MTINDINPILLNVGKAYHNADWNWKNVCSPFARIYYVSEGEAKVRFKDESLIELSPGNIYLIPPFANHSYECDGLFVHYYIHLYEDFLDDRESMFELCNLPRTIQSADGDESLFARLVELNPTMSLEKSNPKSYDDNHTLLQNITKNKRRHISLQLESQGIIYILLSRLFGHTTTSFNIVDKRIVECARYIRKNISSPLNIKKLAGLACLSNDHFIRLFHRSMGCTPLQYINTKRIEKAQHMLISDNMSVKNIAFALGYDDSSYFIRVFRNATGMTPTKYKKKL